MELTGRNINFQQKRGKTMRNHPNDAVFEVRRRAAVLVKKRDRLVTVLLASASAALSGAVAAAAVLLAGSFSGFASDPEDAYGAMMAGEEFGGYALAGVISFLAGVVITVVCIRYQKKKHLRKK